MKKVLLTSVGLASVVSASSVLAADLPSHKAPPMMASISAWQGVYAGINAGYGLNNITTYNQVTGGYAGAGGAPYAASYQNATYVGGAVAGAQVGYNHVFANHWMMGAELDFDWADVYNNTSPNQSNSYQIYGSGLDGTGGSVGRQAYINQNYSRLGMDWIGTVRARVGYDLGKFLPYITGGFAYGGLSYVVNSANSTDTATYNYISFTKGSSSTASVGWAAGAGAEYMVADNWSVKAEYLFTSIGGITTPTNSTISGYNSGTYYMTSGNYNTGSFGVHQVRAGLNYHTNWWGAAPVVAKF